MPTPSTVTIDGVDLTDVESVEFTYETPSDGGYLKSVRPDFGTIELVRSATGRATTKLFALATNNDGTKKTFDGKITLVDDKRADTYAVSFKNAFVEFWSIAQTDKDPKGRETVVLRVEELTFFAGAKNASVNFKDYKG
jgi:hypothetical protein